MRVVSLLVVLLVALAGCSSDPPSEPNPTGTPTGPQTSTSTTPPSGPPVTPTEYTLLRDFGLSECAGLAFATVADSAAIAAALPSGYTPATANVAGLPVDSGQGLLIAELFQCETFSAASTVFPDVWFGRIYTLVLPPEAFAELDADSHSYTFEMLAGPDILGALWPAAGFPTTTGNATMTDATGTGVWTASLDDYSWQLLTPPAPSNQGAGSFAWYHELENGNTNVWTGNETFPSGAVGAGSLGVPSTSVIATSSPLAGITGSVAGQGYRHTGVDMDGMLLVQHVAS